MNLVYIYIYIYWQHFFINTNFVEYYRHFQSTYFLVDPFILPYWFYSIRLELTYIFHNCLFPKYFCSTLGHHRGRMYYKRNIYIYIYIYIKREIYKPLYTSCMYHVTLKICESHMRHIQVCASPTQYNEYRLILVAICIIFSMMFLCAWDIHTKMTENIQQVCNRKETTWYENHAVRQSIQSESRAEPGIRSWSEALGRLWRYGLQGGASIGTHWLQDEDMG